MFKIQIQFLVSAYRLCHSRWDGP